MVRRGDGERKKREEGERKAEEEKKIKEERIRCLEREVNENIEIVDCLLSSGCDVEVKDREGRNALLHQREGMEG